MASLESCQDLLELLPSVDKLEALALSHAAQYQSNQPYPHIVLDDFLPESVAQALLPLFPSPAASEWVRTQIRQEKKHSLSDERSIPAGLRSVLYAFNSATFLDFLEKLTGIDGLIPDPYFSGGGLHQIIRGGKLDLHVDFNKHHKLQLDRRLNLLLYLNPEWEESFGGHFELWDSKARHCAKRVLPVFNRCVIFTTSEQSIHGHPHPLTCPPDRARQSLALYYYSKGRPKSERAFKHGTTFFQAETQEPGSSFQLKLRGLLREALPPFSYRLIKRLATAVGVDS